MKITGKITPHTVKELILPVILAPPKFNIVAIHKTNIVHMAVAKGDK